MLVCCSGLLAQEAPRWDLSYFFDVDNAGMTFREVRFADANRGIVIGTLNDQGRRKPVAMVTADAGVNWTQTVLPDAGLSLFFLNPSLGWMVGEGGIWVTRDAGRSFQILHRRKGIRRVWFLDQKHGFAIGEKAAFLETVDGGIRWTDAALSRKLNLDKSIDFEAISFREGRGVIGGAFLFAPIPFGPPPEARNAVVMLTQDAGANWTFMSLSTPARIWRAEQDRNLLYLLLFGIGGRGGGRTATLFRSTARANTPLYRGGARQPTDFLLAENGSLWLSSYEPAANLPGRVVMLRSTTGQNWTEVPVDYRAVARRVSLTEAAGGALWAVTDTGMILTLR
jgi:hypothetical protein